MTIKGICPEGEILRLGYTRTAHRRKTRAGTIITVPKTKVEPTCIPDVGRKGRGKKIVELGKKLSLRQYNYSSSNTEIERRKSLDAAVKAHSTRDVIVRLNKLTILQGSRPALVKKYSDDIKYLQKKYKYYKLY